jgi:hypothetical protein
MKYPLQFFVTYVNVMVDLAQLWTDIQTTPIQITPIQTTPIQTTPIQITPIQTTPIQITPIHPCLLHYCVLMCTSVQYCQQEGAFASYRRQLQKPYSVCFYNETLRQNKKTSAFVRANVKYVRRNTVAESLYRKK